LPSDRQAAASSADLPQEAEHADRDADPQRDPQPPPALLAAREVKERNGARDREPEDGDG
jgi:hypothetical protein